MKLYTGTAGILFGMSDLLPLRGFPQGRKRIRRRPREYCQVFVRPPEGGVRAFYVTAHDGAWWPAFEAASNTNAPERSGGSAK